MGSTEVLSPEERVERVCMALAEVGFPGAVLTWIEDDRLPLGGHIKCRDRGAIPSRDRWWRALALAGAMPFCWPCWSRHDRREITDDELIATCEHDPLTEPWPPTPSLLSADQEAKP